MMGLLSLSLCWTVLGACDATPIWVTSGTVYLDQPGNYILMADAESWARNASAIEIRSSQVNLNLNGRVLKNPDPSNQAVAIEIHEYCRSVRVFNGTLVGYLIGVMAKAHGASHRVEGLTILGSMFGIYMNEGVGYLIRGNRIHVRGDRTQRFESCGVLVSGDRHLIVENQIRGDVQGSSLMFHCGIQVGYGEQVRVLANDVFSLDLPADPSVGVGILFFADSGVVEGNRLMFEGIRGFVTNSVDVKYRDNLVGVRVPVPYVNGTDAGNNH